MYRLVFYVCFLYSIGVNKVRMSRNGKELPNVRILRTSLFPDKDIPDDLNLLMVMQWGQLIAHDTTHIVQQDSGSYIQYMHTYSVTL